MLSPQARRLPWRVLPVLLLLSLPVQADDSRRGQLLYENHCTQCHDSRAHIRSGRRAETLADVRSWVKRWANTLALGWTGEERNDVAGYLYERYYAQ